MDHRRTSQVGKCVLCLCALCVAVWSAERPPQHPELRKAINLGKYDQAREYIKQGAEEIYCGDMPADSAKAVWDKRWKKEPYHALRGCLRQYTSFYPEKACQSKWSSPEICAGRLKDSASLADPKRFHALASAALDDSEYKTLLKSEIALLGEGRLMALADDAGFDFARDSVLPESMSAWTVMLRDLQRKFKLFGNGERDFYPGSAKWVASPRLQASVEAHKTAKAIKAKADSAHAAIWKRAARRGESRSLPEERTVHIIKIVEVVDYTPTGRRIVVYSDGAATTPQFTGKEMDSETGLYHFGARQYDPELALWAQVDPGRQFASPYAYAGNGVNPLRFADVDGEKAGDLIFFSQHPGTDFPFHIGYDVGKGNVLMISGDGGKINEYNREEYLKRTGKGIVGFANISKYIALYDFTGNVYKHIFDLEDAFQRWNNIGTVCVDVMTAGLGKIDHSSSWEKFQNDMLEDYAKHKQSYDLKPNDPFFYRRNTILVNFFKNVGLFRSEE